MEFYDRKDLEYWRKQAEIGKAVIIEIPVSMLLDLDIRSLSRTKTNTVTYEDLEAWIEENREALMEELDVEARQKAEVEEMEKTLYKNNPAGAPALNGGRGDRTQTERGSSDKRQDASRTVAEIMKTETFTEQQIAVIAQAMLEELPDRYLLCFMKKEYSPEVMQKLKDYCTKLYQEESGIVSP